MSIVMASVTAIYLLHVFIISDSGESNFDHPPAEIADEQLTSPFAAIDDQLSQIICIGGFARDADR